MLRTAAANPGMAMPTPTTNFMKPNALSLSSFCALVLAVASTGALVSSAYATTYTWINTSATSQNWSTATNWSSSAVPVNNDTADITINDTAVQTWNLVVDPQNSSNPSNNWAVNSITFNNNGTGNSQRQITGATNATLTLGAGGIAQNEASSPSLAVPLIASATQKWNINNWNSNNTGGLYINGNITLNNGVMITKGSSVATAGAAKDLWFYSGSTTTVGTGAFMLDGGYIEFSGAGQFGRLGTNTLTVSSNPLYRTGLSFIDSSGGTFTNNINYVGSLIGSNTSFKFIYGNGSVAAGTTMTLTGQLSGNIYGGGTNGTGFIDSAVVSTTTYDDRYKLVFQGNSPGLTATGATYANGRGVLQIAQGVNVLDNANALGTGNSLPVFIGNNSNDTYNSYCGLLATNGNNVSGEIYVRWVQNGDTYRNTVSEIGLSGTGSVTFSSPFYLNTNSANGYAGTGGGANQLSHLKLTAPAGGTAIFSGAISDTASTDVNYTPIVVLAGGTVKLSGCNSYKGTTSVRGGTLLLGSYNNAMGDQGTGVTNVSLGDTVTAPTGGDVAAATTAEFSNVSSYSSGTITFSSAVTTLDGVTLANGNRILYKDAVWNPERTGVYTRTDATHWTRATDLNTVASFSSGLRIHVTGGTLNAGKNFYLETGLLSTAVINDGTSADAAPSFKRAKFLFNPDVDSTTNVAILTDSALTVSRNIDVPNNLSTGKSILGGNSAVASAFTGTVALSKNLTVSAVNGGTVTFSGNITGSSGVIKEGTGTVLFSGTKSYTGTTTVSGGTLTVNGTLASSSVAVNSGATLAGTGTISHAVAVSGSLAPGNSGIGTLTVGSASFVSGSILAMQIGGASADQLVSTGALNLNGAALNITLTGIGWAQPSYVIAQGSSLTGTFASVPSGYAVTYTSTQAILRAPTAYYYVTPTGSDTANNGLTLGTPFATITHAAPYLLAGDTCLIAAGTYSGAITLSQATPANARIAFQNNASETVNIGGTVTLNNTLTLSCPGGATFNFTGDVTGSGGIIKEGLGSAVYTGTKSYTGSTSVTTGTLTVNGTLASSSVTVSSGATLSGTGTITNGMSISGTISPGGSGATGTLTVGSASFATGGTLAVEVNGTSCDKLLSTGALNLTGASLTISPIGSGMTQSSYVIAQGTSLKGTFSSVPDGYAVSYSATQVTLTSVPAYYVSPTGSDTTNNGLSVNAPFATISKAASMMVAGNTCLIRAGTYRETVTVPHSGTASAPITFKAYNHEAVTISGTDPIPGWTLESTNVYKATTMPTGWTTLGDNNQVFQNGAMQPLARWPNKDNTNGTVYPWPNSTLAHPAPYSAVGDWSYVDSATYTTVASFVDAQLPSHSNGYWNGAHVHIMSGAGWYMQCRNVTGYTDSTKTMVTDDTNVSPGGAYTISAGNEYYLTGIKKEMDSPGEWFYDTSTSRLDIYSTTTPTGVEVKSRLYGFNLLGKSFVNLVNLSFFGCTIQNYQNSSQSYSTDCTFDGLSMKFLTHNESGGGDPGLYIGPRSVLRNSELAYSSNGMIDLIGPDIRVINNHIHHNAYLPEGASAVDTSNYVASGPLAAYRNLVSHNTIHTTGHSCIGGVGHAGIIEYNDLYDGMNLSTDGGILYSAGESGNTIVRYNLIHDATGPVGHGGNGILGFYLDCENSRWIVHHNIIWNLPFYAMQFNARGNFDMVFNNTCWNCAGGSLASSFWGDGETGHKFYNNLFNAAFSSTQDIWAKSDLRYNLNTDPPYVDPVNRNFQLQASSPAIDAGTVIPGVTDGYLGSAPDMGALEYGAADWTTSAGCNATPPSPDPVYSVADKSYADQVVDGSFESGSLSPNWTVSSGSNCGLTCSSAWYDVQQRSGYFTLQFGGGTSEISQVVTGLLPDTRYKFFCGVQKSDASAVVKIGVRNYGFPNQETTVPTTSTWQESSYDPVARLYSVTFITGATNTSATIYVDVTRAANSPVAPKASNGTYPTTAAASVYLGNYNNSSLVNPYYPPTGVYVDDLCVIRTNPQPDSVENSPLVHYALNETSGLNTHDSSIYGRDGTVNSTSPLWQTGIIGNALGFNGVGDYLVTPAITTPTSLTVACWAKAPSNASPSNNSTWNANGCFISKRPSFVLGPVAGSKNLSFIVLNGTTGLPVTLTWTPSSSFDITTWHHYAGVFSPTTQQMLIYVDGAQVSSQTANFPINPDTLDSTNGELVANIGKIYIGREDYWLDNTRNFNGVLDDVAVYDRALTTQQIQNLITEDPTEMLHLTFDESTGSTRAWDSSLYAASATLVNMATSSAWVAGKINGALHFDGMTGYVQTPAMTTPANLTMECWAMSDLPIWGNNGGCLIAATPAFLLTPIAGTRNLQFTVNTSTTPVSLQWTAPLGFEVNIWHHYAAVYSLATQTMSIYVDGTQVASGAGPASLVQTTCPVTIGADDSWTQPYVSGNSSSGRHFLGTLDDVQLYSRALSSYELLEPRHQTITTPFALTPNLSSDYTQDGLPNTWKLQYGLNPYVAYSAADSSLSHDGIGLLMKYATGQNPLADSSDALPKVTSEVNPADHLTYLMFRYLRRTDYPQLTYTVQVSNDLHSWNSGSTYASELGATPTGDGVTELVTVRILPAINRNTPLRAARLHVTSP